MANNKTDTFELKINYNLPYLPEYGEIAFIVGQFNHHNLCRHSDVDVTLELIYETLSKKFPNFEWQIESEIGIIHLYAQGYDREIISIFQLEYEKEDYFGDLSFINDEPSYNNPNEF